MRKKYEPLFKSGLRPRLGTGIKFGLGFGLGFGIPVSFIFWFIDSINKGYEADKKIAITSVATCGIFGAACGGAINYGAFKIRQASPNQKANILLLALWGIGFWSLSEKITNAPLRRMELNYEERMLRYEGYRSSYVNRAGSFDLLTETEKKWLNREKYLLQHEKSRLEEEYKKRGLQHEQWKLQQFEEIAVIYDLESVEQNPSIKM